MPVLGLPLSDEQLWDVLNGVLPAWLLLAVAPRWRYTIPIVTLTAAFYSLLYVGAMAGTIAGGDSAVDFADMFTFEGVARLLSERSAVLPAWVHYVAFDLWVARWEVVDARERGVPQLLMLAPLFLTMMAGPSGLLLYLALIRPCVQEGCADGSAGLGFQQCQLLASNDTLWPTGLHGADIGTTAVFALSAHPETFPGFATLPAQGLDGADFECAGTMQPGACVFQSAFDAVAICAWLSECRAVTVFANGTDGHSEPAAVLKSSPLAPSNSFLAPSVYSVQRTEPFPLVALHLHPGEAEVVVPSDAEMLAETAEAAGGGGAAANSTAWLGCIVANNSLMAGAVVDVVDGVEAAEECCMLCRQTDGGACNAWHWCPQAGGCSYTEDRVEVTLQQYQCELRFQSLVAPKLGWPPALLGKGPHIPFVSGSPLMTVAPPLPGYKRLLGSGLFGQRGYTCPESLKPQIQECVRSSSLEGHAQYCNADPRCVAFAYKPAGVYDSVQGTAIYKSSVNSTAILLTPSTVLYIRGEETASSLSAGAVAGISIGAAALVAAAAALLQQDLLQESALSAQLDVGAQLAALPSNLPPELTSWVIKPEDITLLTWPNGSLKELGSGAGGRVLKAIYRGEVVAAKEIDLGRNLDAQQAFIKEALSLQQLRHPHVVSFSGVSLDGPRGIILQEFCEGRDLHSALQLQSSGGSGRAFGWYRRGRRVALDVARALNYLHSMGVVHMDVKSSNVLLTASGAAKLGDVGLSKRQNRTYLSDVAAIGTFDWAAPEILMNGMQCTAAVDLFSFGVLLYEIITGEPPVRGRLRIPSVPEECPEAARDLMLQCLSVSPAARPSAQEAMQRLAAMQQPSLRASLSGPADRN
ncbi:serine threonine- kinase receptor R831 [Chlorella sorokiniana]|uniref:Serine threonine-kinase receptor R831 n=1 Tax=Chlorella sorokiniana TaxID=3076 RepID=A0A2P6THA2_CHLSO|nr:serine threonine- kinase receptor R831 [Chlorella sorokiniana]|eukprot:PRW33664.1 serine threonine- kinase receptor R831 [Chlorella sorokiniana]